jgi:Flp pilus assembly pilin Flp
MIEKVQYALVSAMLKAKQEMRKLTREEDGMEMMETIILIAIAVIIGGVIINALGDENGGLIGMIWDKISDWLDTLFG